ncbi:hypothetical protein DF122_00635 [Burkholderia pseudomallei]|nr:hypothetical protein DF127_03475 [Burkholderia pseudomallei]RPE25980.1 hypothetical protein DF068_00625 [Burkholderia pseudomallei]RQT00152.1 hypothetical protein DF125_00625 [Burkholderia pseudomallei]RQZ56618.1 hypothetical protein DF060_00620 [Burkholderia pseudomallei]RSK72641.1 hypothetical protein DF122_00635 [Burkholderia pseudomallei]
MLILVNSEENHFVGRCRSEKTFTIRCRSLELGMSIAPRLYSTREVGVRDER